jgi:hypothetical protein
MDDEDMFPRARIDGLTLMEGPVWQAIYRCLVKPPRRLGTTDWNETLVAPPIQLLFPCLLLVNIDP